MKSLWHMLTASLGWIAPDTCVVCRQNLTVGEQMLCMECLAALPRTWYHRQTFNELHTRFGRSVPVRTAAAWIHYMPDTSWASLVRTAKYADRPAIARYCGGTYARELLADGLLGDVDVLLPVAMHSSRQLRRTYNQALEFARGISHATGIPVGDNLVSTHRHSTQTRRNSYERMLNARGSIAVEHPHELKDLTVAVVDDVITTGATITACLEAIAQAGPRQVDVLALGATRRR